MRDHRRWGWMGSTHLNMAMGDDRRAGECLRGLCRARQFEARALEPQDKAAGTTGGQCVHGMQWFEARNVRRRWRHLLV
nr:hypothetical protein SHINE37_40916 [Rhizobiaceae bacterium]